MSAWFDERNLDFTRANFNAYVSYLKEKNYKATYINTFIKFAKHLDSYLQTKALTDYTYFKESEKVTECLTPEEISKLALCRIKYIRLKKEKAARMKALIFFLGCVGSRIEETLALRKADLSMEKDPLVYFRPETVKGRVKGRYCVIPQWLYKLLLDLPDANTLFGIDKTVVIHDLKARAIKCGIKKNVYPHLFRHSSINNKLQAGMPLELVTSYHGHASTTTTYKYYIHIQQKQMAEVLYMYDPFFKQGLTFEMLGNKVTESVKRITDGNLCDTVFEISQKEIIIHLKNPSFFSPK